MPAPLPIRVDPVRDALASIDAPPFELDAALREQRDGADPRSALELLVSEVADGLRRDAPEAMPLPGRVNVPSADASTLAAHLRATLRTRATNPAFHARRLSEARRALARIARVDRFAAERRAAGDVPAEAMLRVLAFVRAAWSEVPGGMDGAPPEPPVLVPVFNEAAGREVPGDFNPAPPPLPDTLRESIAAHVAHADRLRARQSRRARRTAPTPPPVNRAPDWSSRLAGERSEAVIPTERRTPPVSRAFAARVKGDTRDVFAGRMDRGEIRSDPGGSPERTVFDAEQFKSDVPTRSPDAVEAVFRCFEKSRDEADAILTESDKFERAEIDAILARLFPPRRVRRKPGK